MCTGTALLFVVCYIVIPTIVIVHCYFDHCALLFIQCMNLFLTILSCPSSDSKVERAEYRCNWRYEFPTVTLGRGTLSRIQPVITHTCVRLMQSRAHFMQGREHWIRMQGRARWMLGRAHWMVGRVRLMPGRARDAGPRALDALHRALDAGCAGCRAAPPPGRALDAGQRALDAGTRAGCRAARAQRLDAVLCSLDSGLLVLDAEPRAGRRGARAGFGARTLDAGPRAGLRAASAGFWAARAGCRAVRAG